jgi:hypothetical protein
MNKILPVTVALIIWTAASNAADTKHAFVGVKACAPCHRTEKQGKQSVVWQGTQHAKAFATLETPEAAKVAEKAGIKGAAHEAAACLKCHATAADMPAAQVKAGFSPADGVQCETCHGPGSDYKVLGIMKDHAKAVAAGLIPVKISDGSAEKQCTSCHNQQSPTFKGFDMKTAWAKIAHPVPKTK